MKVKFFFFLLLISTFCYAQKITITVLLKNEKTGVPIEEATITAVKTKQGFLTNSEGKATLTLPKHSVLEISHFSYKTYWIKTEKLTKEVNEILLEDTTQLLEEVIVTKNHPQDILKNIIATSKAKITLPINLKIYMREFYKKNNDYAFFNDGLLNFQILGSNNKNIKTDILIEQNRAIGLQLFHPKEVILGYNLNDIIQKYYQFSYLDEIISKKARKQYDFQVKTYPQNNDCLVIQAVPFSTEKGMLSNFHIVYNTKKKIILHIAAFLSNERLRLLKEKANSKVRKLEYHNSFRYKNGIYYLTNSKEVICFYRKFKNEKQRIEVKNNMLITAYSKKMFRYNKDNVFKNKTLLNIKPKVFTPYWENTSGLILTNKEQEILDKLSLLH